MLDKFNKYRNKNGYIVIDDIKDKHKLDKETFGSREKHWLDLDGEEVLFKVSQKDGEDIKEIINEQISNYLGVPTVHSDLAIYGDKKGIISLPFITGNDMFLPVLLLLFESKTVGISNDILTIYKALLEKGTSEQELLDIMHMYFASQVQDIFTFQFDRNIENSGIILRNNLFAFAPRYDSSGSFFKFYSDKAINKLFWKANKREYVYDQGWGRTKLKIVSSHSVKSSIDEFINFRYVDELRQTLPKIMQQAIGGSDHYVSKMMNFDFSAVNNYLSNYNIEISKMYQKLVGFAIDLSKEEYESGVNFVEKYGCIK